MLRLVQPALPIWCCNEPNNTIIQHAGEWLVAMVPAMSMSAVLTNVKGLEVLVEGEDRLALPADCVIDIAVRVQVIAGVFQSTGWPSVVAIMANWFGKGKRGLVMGVWNAHTSLGNIMGTVVAAACLQYGWGYAFIVPGVLICFMGVIVYGFLVVQPSEVGLGGSSYEQIKCDEVRQGCWLWMVASAAVAGGIL